MFQQRIDLQSKKEHSAGLNDTLRKMCFPCTISWTSKPKHKRPLSRHIGTIYLCHVGYCRPNIDPRAWLSFPTVTEWIGITKRSLGACGGQFSGAAGVAGMAGIIYFIRDWRLAQSVMAALMGVVAVYIWCVWVTYSSGRQGSRVTMIQHLFCYLRL